MKRAIILSAGILLSLSAPADVTGTYSCQLGSFVRPNNEWKTAEQDLQIKSGEGELEMKVGDLTATVLAGVCCGGTESRLTFQLKDEVSGIRVQAEAVTGASNPGVALYNDNLNVDVSAGHIYCTWPPAK